MSPLTKLFVVLLVLVSTVLTAGVVTFVNKIEPLQQQLTATKTQLDNATALAQKGSSDLAAATGQINTLRAANQAEISGNLATIQTLRASIEKSEAQIAQLNSQIAVNTSTIASANAAVQSSQEAQGKMSDQIVALRKDSDERLRQVADLGTRVSKLTAENDVLERTRRNLAEQVTELQNKTDRQARILQDNGFPQERLDKEQGGLRAGAPAVNGIVRSRRTIAGKEYATISIGTADQVVKGMQFNILDAKTGAFLGVMTVTDVDANEAIGQIKAEGTNLAAIKAGNVVRTQI